MCRCKQCENREPKKEEKSESHPGVKIHMSVLPNGYFNSLGDEKWLQNAERVVLKELNSISVFFEE